MSLFYEHEHISFSFSPNQKKKISKWKFVESNRIIFHKNHKNRMIYILYYKSGVMKYYITYCYIIIQFISLFALCSFVSAPKWNVSKYFLFILLKLILRWKYIFEMQRIASIVFIYQTIRFSQWFVIIITICSSLKFNWIFFLSWIEVLYGICEV